MDLIKNGAQTIKIFDNDHEQEFIDTVKSFPEFHQNGELPLCVLGGFGAFGHPSSFHHPFVKKIRQQVFDVNTS
jgi:hypothetical protein